jgi:hypothetical protein
MKFRNPWIDPRVTQVRPEDVHAYLTSRGWKLLGPESDPQLMRYELERQEDGPTLFAPVQTDGGAALQWMIDLIGELASFEGRWATEVTEDILQQAGRETNNGAGDVEANQRTGGPAFPESGNGLR